MSLCKCYPVHMSTHRDARGPLTFMEVGREIPFEVRRLFYCYDFPDGGTRGAHAHQSCHQLIVAVNGGVDLILDDGTTAAVASLRQPDEGFYVAPMTWMTLRAASPGTVALVLASMPYQESEYIRDHDVFLRKVQEQAGDP